MNPVLLLLGEVTLVFAVGLLGAVAASRARAAVRHLILASAFGVALMLPLATLVSPTITVEIDALPAREPEPVAANPVFPPVVAPTDDMPLTAETRPFATTPPPSVTTRSIPVSTWLLLGWAAVALLALMPVIAGLWHLRSIRRSSHVWSEGAQRVAQLKHPAASPRLAILLNVKIAAPITGGLVRPAIALPAEAMTWSDTHLVNALLHELEHVRRHDWAMHLAARVACAIYWFHPLSWIAWRMLRLEAEKACDDAVLAREDATAYAEQLLELARRLSGKPVLPGLQMAGDSSLASRIKAVLDSTRPRGRTGKLVLASVAAAAIIAIATLAPLRPTGPTRSAAAPPVTGPVMAADLAASPLQPAELPPPAFIYDKRVGLADLRNGGCLSIFNASVGAGTRVVLVKPGSSDPPTVMEATVDAIQAGKCRSSLDRNHSDASDPTYYRLAMPAGETQVGVMFAVLDPSGPLSLVDGQIAADIDGDGESETFGTCASTENVHYMIWTGATSQKRQRWHGNVYVGYDLEPSCTERDMAGMEALAIAQDEKPAPIAESRTNASLAPSAPSPTMVVSSILELVQSALADEVTGKLDDITRPITGLRHVQRRAQAVLNDDGSNPGALAVNYVDIINALVITANSAATIAGRRPDLQLPPEKFQQLAAAMRAKSVELATVVMPVSAIQPNVTSAAHRAALKALELAQAARRETRFAPSWLPAQLSTLERAALSVASDDGATSSATTMKVNLLRSSIETATRQANEIAGRNNVAAEARRKAAELATSLSGVVDQLDGRTINAGLTSGIDWLVTVRSAGPLPIGASISDVRSLIGDPAAYLTEVLYMDHELTREPDDSSCGYLVSTRIPALVGLMFQKGRLVRIDVGTQELRTTAGAKVGDSEARILELYGSRIRVTPHRHPPAGGNYMIFTPADESDRAYRMIFETSSAKVTQFRAGLRTAVDQAEGCQ